MGALSLEELFDRVAELKAAGRYGPFAEAEAAPRDEAAAGLAAILRDPRMRPEHRARVYKDLVRMRDRILETADARMVQLVYWSEHVEALYRSLTQKRLSTFHYARALEATCRRAGFELLGLVGRMKELGRHWAQGEYGKVMDMFGGGAQEEPLDELRESNPPRH